jgi:hypothetical protein
LWVKQAEIDLRWKKFYGGKGDVIADHDGDAIFYPGGTPVTQSGQYDEKPILRD